MIEAGAVPIFYELPDADPMPLEVAPRLASWMARDHPDQVRLAAFLEHAAGLANPTIAGIDGALALRLDVGLAADVDPLIHHDLDNYLFPLVARLGPRRFASVWATKLTGEQSSIRVERPRERADAASAEPYEVRTTRSAETAAFKQEVSGQLVGVAEIAPGSVELEVSFRVGPRRNWANLWKPTIDSLGPLLGTDDARPSNPRDGRITRLGLHQQVDSAQGHEVEIAIIAAPAHG